MDLVKDTKILIAITTRPEFYYDLIHSPEFKTETGFNNLFGPKLYIVSNQVENIKYWYNDQKQELKEYLKNNI